MRDERWDKLADEDWAKFAQAWVAELSGIENVQLPDLPQLFADDPTTEAVAFVVQMNFFGSPQAQWKFILAAFEHADENALGDLAAGPIEHILGHHGEEYIDKVESLAKNNSRFARMLQGCWQNQISDEHWERVCMVRVSEV